MALITDLTHGSLFSGIGGFDTGAERAGFTNLYNSEINSFCNRQLKIRFPNAIQYADITTIQSVPKTTVISAGFPCQDISISKADKAQGLFGEQSSLFFEALRIVDLSRPDYFVMENSPMLPKRGLHYILAALANIGYMCEWQCLQASDFGYPHKRKRIYIIAYPLSKRLRHLVFRPIETIDLYAAKWIPTPTYLRVSTVGAKPSGFSPIVCSSDVVPGFSQYIHAYGNAVMPVVAEYIFKCIKLHIETI